jgi:F-type H+-transporting ATPase subunit a
MNPLPLILAQSDPAAEVWNHPYWRSSGGFWLWSGHQGSLVLSGVILIVLMLWVASKVRTGPESDGHDRYVTKSRFAHMFEVILVYLREEIVRPMLGDRTDRFMPFLWTVFLFVLINNILGLFPIMGTLWLLFPSLEHSETTPIGGTATQNIWVTGALALVAGVVFNLAALKRLGPTGFMKHMTGGAPWYVAWMIIPIELAGQFIIKPGALAIRLFANMTAGHILLAALFLFVAQVWTHPNLVLKGSVSFFSVAGAIGVMFLELFVAFVQAFIFMFLTALFVALMDHHDEHGHEHEPGHATGHEAA